MCDACEAMITEQVEGKSSRLGMWKRLLAWGFMVGTVLIVGHRIYEACPTSSPAAVSKPKPSLREEIKSDRQELRYESHNRGRNAVSNIGAAVSREVLEQEDAEPFPQTITLSASEHFPAMVVPRDGLVFCPIAKVACAEWRKAFRWMLGVRDWENGPIHDWKKNQIPLLSNMGKDEANHIVNDPTWVKFVIVRDPEERLLSGFLNKCNNYVREYPNCPYLTMMPDLFPEAMKPLPRKPNPQIHAHFGKLVNQQPGEVFLHWARGVRKDIERYGCDVNSHWRPQHCFCGLEKSLAAYDVFSFRNLTSVGVEVAEKLILPETERKAKVTAFLKERFASNHDTKDKRRGASTAKSKFITAEISEITRQAYAKDYELLEPYF